MFIIPLTLASLVALNHQSDPSIVTVRIENQNQIQILRDSGAQSLACFDHVGATPMLLDEPQQALVKKLQLEFEVIEPSLNAYLEEFAQKRAQSRARGIGGWYSDFRTWQEVNERLNQTALLHPSITSLFTVGTTHEGRNIQGIRITAPGDSTDRKQVLWNGCQHAREWVAVMVPAFIIDELVSGWYTNPEIQSLLETTEVIVVPIVNPDGYEYTYAIGGERFWRKNRRDNNGSCEGVDLNRNWSHDWNGGDSTSTNTCSEVYVGPSAFSEPESQAMRDLVLSLPNLVAHIDFHSYSQLVLEPWASSYDPPPRENIVKSLSNAMSDAIYGVHGETYVAGTGGDLLYLADGIFPDWTTEQGALSYTIELRPSGSPGFELPPEEILPTCEESFQAALEMLRFVNQPLTFSLPNGVPSFANPGDMVSIPLVIESIFNDEINESTATLHVRYGGSGEFAQRTIEHATGTNYEVLLPVSLCGHESEYWFSVETDAGETFRYPEAEETLKIGVATDLHMFDMNENPNWSTTGQWAWGIPVGGGGEYGNPDPTSGATGQHVFGYNLQGDYANNLDEKYLTTNPINISEYENVQLQFSRYLNVEQPAYDHASIAIRTNASSGWSTIWSNQSTIEDNQWQNMIYDLSEFTNDADTVEIRWVMGETDGGWRYSGWNIDDVQLMTTTSDGVSGDVNCDGYVNVTDVLEVVSLWGPCDGVCAADIVPDGTINVADLLQVIGNW